MDKTKITETILGSLDEVSEGRELPVDAEGELYGKSGQLTSMELVSFVLALEQELNDHGVEVSLLNEKAMSQNRSPFKTVQDLTDYVMTLTSDPDPK